MPRPLVQTQGWVAHLCCSLKVSGAHQSQKIANCASAAAAIDSDLHVKHNIAKRAACYSSNNGNSSNNNDKNDNKSNVNKNNNNNKKKKTPNQNVGDDVGDGNHFCLINYCCNRSDGSRGVRCRRISLPLQGKTQPLSERAPELCFLQSAMSASAGSPP